MRTQTRILLGETSEDGYRDTEINTALNNAALKVATDLLCLQTHHDQTTVAYTEPTLDPDDGRTTGRYPLPTDFLALRDVQIQYGGIWYQLVRVGYDEFQARARTSTGGLAKIYRLETGATALGAGTPGDLWLYPYPDSDDYLLRIVHYQKPTAMTDDSDTSELPESAHMAVCYHAALVLSRKFKDRDLVNEMAALWIEEMDMLRKMVVQQDKTGPKYVRNVY
jgi:hypothetical protein